jgi:outer membrane protein assembly factor BamE (lipoprotein component of BamABCDE complex)
MTKTTATALTVMMGLIVSGCYGYPIHSTIKYNKVHSVISRNNKNLINLKIGMTQEQVQQHMGQPERSEGYEWGSAWLYRTAMTSGVYGTADGDFTPVVFDENGKLIGWGRNFYTEYVKRYEIKIKKE